MVMLDTFESLSRQFSQSSDFTSRRSPLTLERIIIDLGSTLLTPVTPVNNPYQRIASVFAYDPLDEQVIPAESVVLGIGLASPDELLRCLALMSSAGSTVLIVRRAKELPEAVSRLALNTGTSIFELVSGASWTQLSNLIQSLLVVPESSLDEETIDGLPGGDLFAVSNAISSLLEAPITIEDRNSRVLAFSRGQDEADSARIATILERQVPHEYTRQLESAGFFRKLYSSHTPVTIKLPSDDVEIKTRAAIAVRAGGEILGSIWAALPGELDDERSQLFEEVAKIVALHMLRLRAGDKTDRRMRADLLSTALEGGDGAYYAIKKLGIEGTPVAVFAIGLNLEDGEKVEEVFDGQRTADAIAVYLAAVRPRACTARLGETIYGILPVDSTETGEEQALRLVTDLVARSGTKAGSGTRPGVFGGVGPIVTDSRDLLTAREGARRALRVQLESPDPDSPVAVLSKVYVDSLLLELRDQVSMRGDLLTGPLDKLRSYDVDNGTDFVKTLDIWLNSMGDISKAAELLHVHANTLRYRLRRLAEIAEMDLSDSEVRFAAQLILRINSELREPG